MTETVVTGTVYGLVDPRDDEIRYIGQTTKPLAKRLNGHFSGSTSPRVKAWIAELREAGVTPLILPVREGVPADDLLTAEGEEITRIIVAGGKLLNEQGTAAGRKLNYRRRPRSESAPAVMNL